MDLVCAVKIAIAVLTGRIQEMQMISLLTEIEDTRQIKQLNLLSEARSILADMLPIEKSKY